MRNIHWLSLFLAALIALSPDLAEARAGAGSSSGSRGSRTFQAPPPTQTAPTPKPMERSATPQQPTQNSGAASATAAPQPAGFFARNPFVSGLLGGMLGAGFVGMLFGGGFGGFEGMSGGFGLILQLLLIGGLIYLVFRLLRHRSQGMAYTPAYAYAGAASPPHVNMPQIGGPPPIDGASHEVGIVAEDYKSFETLLAEVQAAYSKGDLAKMRSLATPEMVGYFSEQLSANASRGVENKVDAVKLEAGDLSESWSEAGLDYASVAMRFSMTDVTRNIADGRIVEGDDQQRVEATELWTFLRSPGGKWILSAIQQA